MGKFDRLRFSDHKALIEAENLLLWVTVNWHPESKLREQLLAFIAECNKTRKPATKPTFKNQTKRLWNEEECRNMLSAALLYLAHSAGGRLDIDTQAMLDAVENMGTVAMTMSDDDKILTITGMKKI